jgi:putative N-acetylmannosamine-6-phosphate epimerase
MKNIDTDAKLDTGSNLEKKKVCKSFADLSQFMGLVKKDQPSCEIYKTSTSKAIQEKKEIGND